MDATDFWLADELRYIQRRAAEYDARFVTVGELAMFFTEIGDAWLLDPAEHLAARVARRAGRSNLRKPTPSWRSDGGKLPD